MATLGVRWGATPDIGGSMSSLGASLAGAVSPNTNSRAARDAAYMESLQHHNQVYDSQAQKLAAETAAKQQELDFANQQNNRAQTAADVAWQSADAKMAPAGIGVLPRLNPAIVKYDADSNAAREHFKYAYGSGDGSPESRAKAAKELYPMPAPVGDEKPIFNTEKTQQVVPDPKNPGRYMQVPVAGVPGADTSAAPVSGYPGTEKMTTDQSNAAGFSTRMKSAEEILSDPKNFRKNMGIPGFFNQTNDKIPIIGHGYTDPEWQQFDQAQRNFINAQLRRESGAAISDAEFENARRQYLPGIGDDDVTLATKKKNRADVEQAMLYGTTPGFRQWFGSQGQSNAAPAGQGAPETPAQGGDIYAEAQAAIAAGADPAKVMERLKQMSGK